MEARQRAKMAKTTSKHLKEVLAGAEVDLALERKRREVEVMKAKEELTEVEKKARKKAVEVYKASIVFVVEKARVVVVFYTLEKFYIDYCQFREETFHAGFILGKDDYRT